MSKFEPLITRYRPKAFEEVIGNETAIKSLLAAISSDSCPHAFLFTGPSGIGKTTLARIIASKVGASLVEIDAATNSGVDNTRRLSDLAKLRPITEEDNILYIIDECHSIGSKQAWQPLLKLIEEPPPYLYIALCTTEVQAVPDTIKTRCYPVALKQLKPPEIEELLEVVAGLEGWVVNNDVFQAVVQASEGSARRALSILQAGHACVSRDELSSIIVGIDVDSNPEIELCKHLLKGGTSWKTVSQFLSKIEDFDTAITDVSRYLAAAMARSDEAQARDIWRMIRAISESQGTWDKRVQLYSGIGKILWGTEPF